MHNKERIKIELILSSTDFSYDGFVNTLAAPLTKRFGGATFDKIIGTWSSQGDKFLTVYPPANEIENGARITISILTNEEEAALSYLRKEILQWKKASETKVKWIHIEKTKTEASHFSI